ncbi:hypothetical protein OSTOST_22527, partial [Ostertagia ostertagi]
MLREIVLIYILHIPLVDAFDWGDFHKVAVIFFSFFGPTLILGAIALAAYFACIRSVRGSGPSPVKQLKATPPPMIQKFAPSPIPPGHLISPAPS